MVLTEPQTLSTLVIFLNSNTAPNKPLLLALARANAVHGWLDFAALQRRAMTSSCS